MDEIEVAIFIMIIKMYKKLHLTRSDVQFVIELVNDFICSSYNPFLLKELNKYLNGLISNDVSQQIQRTFEQHSNPFEKFSTEHKRLTLFKRLGLCNEQKIFEIETVVKEDKTVNQSIVYKKPKCFVYLSLIFSLQQLLEIDGLFDATLKYMQSLYSESKYMKNFIQGNLWKITLKEVSSIIKDGIILPLFIYFDDLETGNALGSHAGKNLIGCVYAWIPCLPPSIASKLSSILLTQVFYSNDRKVKNGNKKIFSELIEELNKLSSEGIHIKIKGELKKVYFVTTLILGDNLGLNSILGFVESFSSTRFCRICYVSPEKMSEMTKEEDYLLRNDERHEYDSKNINPKETGVKEECFFNKLNFFKVIKNAVVDIMHDLFEGVVSRVLAKILIKFIDEKKYFTIKQLNEYLNSINFAYESANVPTNLDMEYIRKNEKLKMSAAESLFFVKYLPTIIGEHVPEEDETWSLYIKLREIVQITTSPIISEETFMELETIITEHHRLYNKFFGDLKPKFHNLLHYVRVMKNNGPLINLSAMRFESKHTEIKAILNASY